MLLHTSDNPFLKRPYLTVWLRLMARLAHLFWVVGVGYGVSRWMMPVPGMDPEHLLQAALFGGFLTAVLFQASGVYGESLFNQQLRLRFTARSWTLAFVAIVLFRHLVPTLSALSSAHWMAWYLLTLAGLGVQRLLVHVLLGRLVKKRIGLQNMVILGRTESGNRLTEYLRTHSDVRSQLVGYVDDRARRSEYAMAGLPFLGNTEDLTRLVREGKVQQILIALPWSAGERMGGLIKTLRQLPVHLLLAPDMVALHHARNRITHLGGLPAFDISDFPLRGWSPLVKRVEDIVLASIALLFCAPVMLLIALWIKLDSRGPVLFRQKRYGYNNRLIEVYKFRSMYTEMTDADAAKQTTKDDPRVTRVGRWIRKTSLDELPQLLNVLGGSMSMVGPRPHALATKAAGVLFEDAVDDYTSRHRVKPGITGWAQVNGYRGETDTLEKIEKRVAYDLEYIENWSLWFDLYILVLTPIAVVSGEAAY